VFDYGAYYRAMVAFLWAWLYLPVGNRGKAAHCSDSQHKRGMAE